MSTAAVRKHLRAFFAGHACAEHVWQVGPAHAMLPELRVAEFAPGPKSDLWAYATVGAWRASADPKLEFVFAAEKQNPRHVELLCMTAWYHGTRGLGTGHTLPVGEPWLPGSACDHFLVSTPYPFGPALEICNLKSAHVHVQWLLPVTAAEREFKITNGLEALKSRFDDAGLRYWDADRASVV